MCENIKIEPDEVPSTSWEITSSDSSNESNSSTSYPFCNNFEDILSKQTDDPLDFTIEPSVNSVNKDIGSKKRQRHPEQWQKNVKKQKRNSGESYRTVSGKLVASRSMKPPCGENCRLKCFEIDENVRLKIHEDFWKMGNLTKQRDFITKCLSLVKPKYTMHTDNSKRSFNNAYSFNVNGEQTRVCKKYFQSTLDVGNCFISTAIKKMNSEGVVENERRGKHEKRGRALDESIKDDIRDHINSYPKIHEVHKSNNSKIYLEGNLNLCLMYKQYKESCEAKNISPAKQSMYEHIFRNEFKLSFLRPRKDQDASSSDNKSES